MKQISKRMRILIVIIGIVFLLGALLVGRGIWENNSPILTRYVIKGDDLPVNFDGYKIAQVSDLHNAEIGENNFKVLDILKRANPDVIVITGDIIDSRKTKIDVAVNFVKEANKIAQCYYASGNHESRLDDFESFVSLLEKAGATILRNQKIRLLEDGEYITLLGVEDPAFHVDYLEGDDDGYMNNTLMKIVSEEDGYSVLLSHRPEFLELYSKYDIDVVFSGHAHGGQFVIPLIGGLYAPGQGFFPKITSGVNVKEDTNLVVSRGVGNSAFPFRLNNRPEVVLVELKCEK